MLQKTTVLLTLIVLILGFCPSASADDVPTGVACHQPVVTSINTPAIISVGEVAPISASVSDCYDCEYTWVIHRIDNLDENREIYYTSNLPYQIFYHYGDYNIGLTVNDRAPTCDGYRTWYELHKNVYVVGRQNGFDDNCENPSSPDNNAVEIFPSDVSDGDAYQEFLAGPGRGHACHNCDYMWYIEQSPSPGGVGPFESVDIPHLYETNTENSHYRVSFPQPGYYRVSVLLTNPRSCPDYEILYSSGTRYGRARALVTIRGISPGQTTAPESAPQITPDLIAPIPISGTVSPVQTTVITTSQTANQPQVTLTAIPAATQPVATIPQGTQRQTGQQTGTPAPVNYGTNNQASGAAPVVTNAAPVGADAGTAPTGTTKKTPGFAVGVTLVASLLVIVFQRK